MIQDKISPIVIIIVILLVLVIGAVILKIVKSLQTQANSKKEGYPYRKVDALFTAAERSFLAALDDAVGQQFRVFGKVRIADIANVKKISNRQAWQRAQNKITSKHLDYILCDKNDLSVVCAVELNDKSHQRRDRKERDLFVDNLCQTISLPLVKIEARGVYSVSEIRTILFNAIKEGV